MDPISVLFTIAEDQLPTVLQKMRGRSDACGWTPTTATCGTGSRSGTADHRGQRDRSDHRHGPAARHFDKPEWRLFPNQFVNARLLVEEKRGVMLLPTAAMQRNSQNDVFVYLVKPDSTVTVRNDHHRHQRGRDDGNHSGLAAGRRRGDDRRRQAAGRQQGTRRIPAINSITRRQARRSQAKATASESVPHIYPPAGRDHRC